MVKGASGNLQKEKIINKRKHAGRRPIGIKYFEARMVYRLLLSVLQARLLIVSLHKKNRQRGYHLDFCYGLIIV